MKSLITACLLLLALHAFGATTISKFRTVETDSINLHQHNLGTITGGSTATLSLSTNLYRAVFSGSTFTVNLPAVNGATNSYYAEIAGTNTSGATQVGSIQVATVSTALVREELAINGVPQLVATITNGIGGAFTLRFYAVGGVWSRVNASGDALSIAPNIFGGVGFGVSGEDVVTGKVKGFVVCPYAASITGFNFVVDAGTATVKVWKIATGTAKPTIANVINTSGVAISSGTAIHSTTTSDFTTTDVTKDDIFAFSIEAVAGVTELFFSLQLSR